MDGMRNSATDITTSTSNMDGMSTSAAASTTSTANMDDMSTLAMAITTSTAHQNNPLVKLPAELKNKIFQLTMPTNTIIALRADSDRSRMTLNASAHTPTEQTRYKYKYTPAPGILGTCKEFHTDFSPLYYASNTFFVTDVMFQPRALEGFAVARADVATHIRTVRVLHQYHVMQPYAVDDQGEGNVVDEQDEGNVVDEKGEGKSQSLTEFPVGYTMSFTLEKKDSRVTLVKMRSRQRDIQRSEGFKGIVSGAGGLCCCALERMVESCNATAADGPADMLSMLSLYVNAGNEYKNSVEPHVKLPQEGAEATAKVWERCEKVKGI